jgi:hypothetical protein
VLVQSENCGPLPGVVKAQNLKDRRAATKGMAHEMRLGLIPRHEFTVHIHDPVFEHKSFLRNLEISEKTKNRNIFELGL